MVETGAAIALAAVLAMAPTPVLAEAQVRGSPEAVTIEAEHASIEEILAAVGKAFNVHYRSSNSLEMQLTGIYQGSLQGVLARVLEHYDFVMRTEKGSIEISVFGRRHDPPTAGVSPASTPSKAGAIPAAPPLATSTELKTADQQPAATAAAPAFPVPRLDKASAPPIPSPSPGSAPSPTLDAQPSAAVPLLPDSGPVNGPEPQPSSVLPPAASKPTANIPASSPAR